MFEQVPAIAVLGASCGMAGLAAGIGSYVLAVRVREEAARTRVDLGDKQRRLRRDRAEQESGIFGLMVAALPPFTAVARALPASAGESLLERYVRAGWPGGLDDDEIVGLALLIGVLIAVFATLAILVIYPLAAPLGVLGFLMGPGLVSGSLTRRAADRDRDIARTMPFVLDLLVLTMRAGAPLNTAMERVAIDYARHPIGLEFRSVLMDLEMGVTKEDALANLGNRVPIEAVRTFADDLTEAELLGRPVADTLQRLADRSRERRITQANETAGQAKVMVLVPGMLVFIATLLLLFSPFVVKYFYGGYGGV